MRLQVDTNAATGVILDYGVIGIALLALGYFAWYQYKRDQANSDQIKEELKQSNSKFMESIGRQISIQEKQADLYEKAIAQSKEFNQEVSRKIEEVAKKTDELPAKVVKEINYNKSK